jgi:type II secretory pathway pseudopilin PulG
MKNILLKHLLFTRRLSPNISQSGFSLIELMVITVMIGVLSTIGAAGWEGFTSRQRIRTVNDQVFQALRSAQSDAKLKKEMREVVFFVHDSDSTPKEIKIYPREAPAFPPDPDKPNNPAVREIDLSSDGQIKKGQVKMTFKKDTTNTDIDGETANLMDAGEMVAIKRFKIIKFDYLGSVVSNTNVPIPITITTSTAEDKGKRCIIVETLLGGMRSAQGDECPE